MTPPDESPDKPSARPAHKFPPGLDFLDSIQRAQQTEDREMKCAILSTFLDNVRDHRDLLQKHGYDPERLIAGLEPHLKKAVASNKKVAEIQEQLLHATADMADAMREMVDGMEEAIKVAAEERPFDPQVEEWKETLEEFRKEYPKID
jgi:DNA-binding FrmR family transcriptional regulator